MKQNICELDTMIFFREALEAHEFMLLPVMASAVVECRTADKELKTLNEDGEIGLARLFSIWANMMCAPGAATIVGCRPITMLSEILAQVHAYLTVHPLYDPEGFGCGEDGDVIDFTAKLFDLSPKEAAEKLAQDFGLIYNGQAPPRRR